MAARHHYRVSEVTETVVLWRPTGPEELTLVETSGWRKWPPRLPEQPIFYPVPTVEYATKIARDWNVPASGSGYVTRFEVGSSDKPLPGPALPTLLPAATAGPGIAATPRRRAGGVNVERPTGRTTLTPTSVGAPSKASRPSTP
jgi:hypothetical protein